ncbi:MAG TPA: ATP synthase F1 subunit gamma [Alphaproteobacteria bacterium]|nr:ATP synthase F1 subunit gamma [Alphaproteobacteria bacterium]
MSGLKSLRSRIKSVKQTQKMTSAMKMVAASKLKKAQDQLFSAKGYIEAYASVLNALWLQRKEAEDMPLLIKGHEQDTVHLLIVATADRGLCGSFNTSLIREARTQAYRILHQNEDVRFLVLGKRGVDPLKREFPGCVINDQLDFSIFQGAVREQAVKLGSFLVGLFEKKEVTKISCIFSLYKSPLVQQTVRQRLLPLKPAESLPDLRQGGLYEYEPSFDLLLENASHDLLKAKVFEVLLQRQAGEQGSRMTAMDNATRNSNDIIKKLEVTYNRTRQAAITRELIEIISGAQAV